MYLLMMLNKVWKFYSVAGAIFHTKGKCTYLSRFHDGGFAQGGHTGAKALDATFDVVAA